MPTLGKKKFAYTKKGKAAYKAAKMKESTRNRLVGLMVESNSIRLQEYKARNKERNDAAKLVRKTAKNSRNAEYGPTLSKEDPKLFPNGKANIFPNPAGSPLKSTTSTAPTPTSKANTLPALPNVRSRRRSGAELENSPYGNAADAEFTVRGNSAPKAISKGAGATLPSTEPIDTKPDTKPTSIVKTKETLKSIGKWYRRGKHYGGKLVPNTEVTPPKAQF